MTTCVNFTLVINQNLCLLKSREFEDKFGKDTILEGGGGVWHLCAPFDGDGFYKFWIKIPKFEINLLNLKIKIPNFQLKFANFEWSFLI